VQTPKITGFCGGLSKIRTETAGYTAGMGTVDASGGGASGGRKSRWRRFFSCGCLGGEAVSSSERAKVPVTAPVDQPAVTADPAPSCTRDDDVPHPAGFAPDQPHDTQVSLAENLYSQQTVVLK